MQGVELFKHLGKMTVPKSLFVFIMHLFFLESETIRLHKRNLVLLHLSLDSNAIKYGYDMETTI